MVAREFGGCTLSLQTDLKAAVVVVEAITII